jgi:hypothetical protein
MSDVQFPIWRVLIPETLFAIEGRTRDQTIRLLDILLCGLCIEFVNDRDFMGTSRGRLKFRDGEVITVTDSKLLEIKTQIQYERILVNTIDHGACEWLASVPYPYRYRIDVVV